MCPACLASALLFAGSMISTGGLAAVAIRKFAIKDQVNEPPQPNSAKENSHD